MWLWALLPAVLGPLPSVTLSGPISWRLPGKSSRFDRPGDVVVGGSFSILCFDELTLFNFSAPPVGQASSE